MVLDRAWEVCEPDKSESSTVSILNIHQEHGSRVVKSL